MPEVIGFPNQKSILDQEEFPDHTKTIISTYPEKKGLFRTGGTLIHDVYACFPHPTAPRRAGQHPAALLWPLRPSVRLRAVRRRVS